jgi:hypothetical protein
MEQKNSHVEDGTEQKLSRGIRKFVPTSDARFQAVHELALRLSDDIPQNYNHNKFVQTLWIPQIPTEPQTDEEKTASTNTIANMNVMHGVAK